MLYQQGLTELIHSSPSEQVAYLLVERASLLESSDAPDRLTSDGNTAALLEVEGPQVSGKTTPVIQNKRRRNKMNKLMNKLHRCAIFSSEFIVCECAGFMKDI